MSKYGIMKYNCTFNKKVLFLYMIVTIINEMSALVFISIAELSCSYDKYCFTYYILYRKGTIVCM